MEDVANELVNIAEENSDSDKILLQVKSLQSEIQINQGIDVSIATLRSKGLNSKGYWVKKHPECFSWRGKGSTRDRGLVIDTENVLERQESIIEELPE